MASMVGSRARVRPVLPAMRVMFAVFVLLTLLGFNALYILSAQTEQFFAWTVDPPLTAAFMGSGYGAGFVLVVLAMRARTWAEARVAAVTIEVFNLFTLIATVLHIDRFHFSSESPIAVFAAWFWLAVYVVIPLGVLILLVAQARVPGDDPPTHRPLPAALAPLLAVQGVVLLGVGLALFVNPATSEALWPWTLTPLTARAVAAWLIAFGVAAFLALRERDLGRLATAAVTYTVFGVLQLVALVRFSGTVDWSRVSAWVYLALLISIVLAGGYGWARSRATR
jgi:hypothetical protein